MQCKEIERGGAKLQCKPLEGVGIFHEQTFEGSTEAEGEGALNPALWISLEKSNPTEDRGIIFPHN